MAKTPKRNEIIVQPDGSSSEENSDEDDISSSSEENGDDQEEKVAVDRGQQLVNAIRHDFEHGINDRTEQMGLELKNGYDRYYRIFIRELSKKQFTRRQSMWVVNVADENSAIYKRATSILNARPKVDKRRNITGGGGGGNNLNASTEELTQNIKASKIRDKYDFSNLPGMKNEKRIIEDNFIAVTKFINMFPTTESSILMYGPPGTGKTLFSQSLVNELKRNKVYSDVFFFVARASDIKGSYVGQSEKNLTAFFEKAQMRASSASKGDKEAISFLFFDEIDALTPARGNGPGNNSENITNSFLGLMNPDNYPNVVVIGATNLIWSMDAAILRRFELKLFVGYPSDGARRAILFQTISKYLSNDKPSETQMNQLMRIIDYIVKMTRLTRRGFDEIYAYILSVSPENPETKKKAEEESEEEPKTKREPIVKLEKYFAKSGYRFHIEEGRADGNIKKGIKYGVSDSGFSSAEVDSVCRDGMNKLGIRLLKERAKDDQGDCYPIVPKGADGRQCDKNISNKIHMTYDQFTQEKYYRTLMLAFANFKPTLTTKEIGQFIVYDATKKVPK